MAYVIILYMFIWNKTVKPSTRQKKEFKSAKYNYIKTHCIKHAGKQAKVKDDTK